MNLRIFGTAAPFPRWWSGLGSAEQLAFYIRWSVQIMMLSAVVYLIMAPSVWLSGVSRWWIAFNSAVAVAVGLVGFVVIRDTDQLFVTPLHTAPTVRKSRYLLGFGVTIAAPALIWLVAQFHRPDSDAALVLIWVFMCSGLVGLIYLPRLPHRWIWAVGIGAVVSWLHYESLGLMPLIIMILMLFTAVTSHWTVRVGRDLEKARVTEAAFRVSEERLRFAQELHDTMGQHLAAISLKAEVARALARRNDSRLDQELQQLQELARTSMSEMRQVAAGYRQVNLVTELSSAERILRDAGIEVSISGTPSAVPEKWRETVGWFLRESATNILRHSDATHMLVAVGADGVEMLNDGVVKQMGELGGLSALRRRVMDAGGQLSVVAEDGNFRVRLDFCEPVVTGDVRDTEGSHRAGHLDAEAT